MRSKIEEIYDKIYDLLSLIYIPGPTYMYAYWKKKTKKKIYIYIYIYIYIFHYGNLVGHPG